ncbi:MAG: hypothetical protein IKI77_08385, partial [Oscillospiraceae bacterium]|nr:hypothetical protein [Oscillospiraceae bacterium]
MKRKLLAVLLASAISFTVLPTDAFAAADLILRAEDAEAECIAGNEVSVTIFADQNAGYAAGTVRLSYDMNALIPQSVIFHEAAPDNGSRKIAPESSYLAAFGSYLATENYTGTGAFFTLTFQVADTAEPGDYAVVISNPDIYDAELNPVLTACIAGTVTLTGEPAADCMLLEAGTATVTQDDSGEIRIPVSAAQNPGFAAGFADLLWNPEVLSLSRIEYTDTAPDNGSAAIRNTGTYRVAFGSYLAKTDTAENGLLFTAVFTRIPDSPAGTFPVQIGNAELFHAALEPVKISRKAGAVVVTPDAVETTEPAAETTTAALTTKAETTTSTTKAVTTTTTSTTKAVTTTTTSTTKAATTTTTSTSKAVTTTTTSTTKAATTTTSTTKAAATTTSTSTTKAVTTTTTSTTKTVTTTTTSTTKAATTTN